MRIPYACSIHSGACSIPPAFTLTPSHPRPPLPPRLAAQLATTVVLTTVYVDLFNDPALFARRLVKTRDHRILGVVAAFTGGMCSAGIVFASSSAVAFGVAAGALFARLPPALHFAKRSADAHPCRLALDRCARVARHSFRSLVVVVESVQLLVFSLDECIHETLSRHQPPPTQRERPVRWEKPFAVPPSGSRPRLLPPSPDGHEPKRVPELPRVDRAPELLRRPRQGAHAVLAHEVLDPQRAVGGALPCR